ncbi:MAG: DUF4177 domain-containing protein [Candidatus Nanoarchaeia archaeon]
MKFEYKVIGLIHAGMINPWKVNKDNEFVEQTKELNKLGEEGWELVSLFSAGNNDRGVYILKRTKE